jgi:hypothetical protein
MIDVINPQFWQTTQQTRNRTLALDAGQLGANAVMDTSAKRQRAHVASGGVTIYRDPDRRRCQGDISVVISDPQDLD